MTSEGRVCLGLADMKESDWQMNAWTLRACDIVRAR